MIEQRSQEWFNERAGRITASEMHVVMLDRDREPFKSGPRKGQIKPPPKAISDYAHRLAAERITGKPRKQIKAKSLEHGQITEPYAVLAYEIQTGLTVELCGFVIHPKHDFIGASPDFLVESDGGGEVKCPESSEVHLSTLINGLPAEHIEQIQGGLWVTGRKWWDFVSYHGDFPDHLKLYIQRVPRDEAFIERLESACILLNDEVSKTIDQLKRIAA
jgi:hypothetical protein